MFENIQPYDDGRGGVSMETTYAKLVNFTKGEIIELQNETSLDGPKCTIRNITQGLVKEEMKKFWSTLNYAGIVSLPWDSSSPKYHSIKDMQTTIYYHTRSYQVKYIAYDQRDKIIIEKYSDSSFTSKSLLAYEFKNYICPVANVAELTLSE